MKKVILGVLAHVDAGKTTLSEGLLYRSGNIGKLGRVDHKNAFLDTDSLERERGITIFSKQAILSMPELEITLIDTPGHVDFSAEMERTLQILDYAVLVISGSDGVQGHTETLWRLLRRYRVPTFLFINKMDLVSADKNALMQEMHHRLSDHCVDFGEAPDQRDEQLSLCEEALLDEYLEAGTLSHDTIASAIAECQVFPCRFGSALKLEGVDEFLQDLSEWTLERQYPEEFGATVYKIARDPQGARLTYLKVTGGILKVKDVLHGEDQDGEWAEKADQLRCYSGEKFKAAEAVTAGSVCAVTGLTKTFAGQGLGIQAMSQAPLLEPVLTYQMILPIDYNIPEVLQKLRCLEEEDPQLHILWKEQLHEIHVQVMGEVQLEVLQRKIRDRFGLIVGFDQGSVVYRETIANTVEGVGHFEPLRHYAEVHLLLEPGERGSGLVFSSRCSTDVLDLNWQRLILTHLEEKPHLGVLTGSPITDMKITLLNGKASLAHTEGGDFRQATYRAVRHGLRKAESVLLEPCYDFVMELPMEAVGRAMTDIQRMNGSCSGPETFGTAVRLKGWAPVSSMQGYSAELAAYTKGRGRLSLNAGRYEVCQEQDRVVEMLAYDPDSDLENTADSVFCSHGAGYPVPWDEVEDHMHLPLSYPPKEGGEEAQVVFQSPSSRQRTAYRGIEDDAELQAIFERTYGPSKREFIPRKQDVTFREHVPVYIPSPQASLPEYLLVDGYNIIFAWEELKDLARDNIDAARQSLADILSNYQGYRKCKVILVFDAYKVHGNPGSVQQYHNIDIVFTKEAQTADAYIEKVTYEIGKKYRVRVATSDNLEQLIILGHGAQRVSARAFHEEVQNTHTEIREVVQRACARAKRGSTIGEIVGNLTKK